MNLKKFFSILIIFLFCKILISAEVVDVFDCEQFSVKWISAVRKDCDVFELCKKYAILNGCSFFKDSKSDVLSNEVIFNSKVESCKEFQKIIKDVSILELTFPKCDLEKSAEINAFFDQLNSNFLSKKLPTVIILSNNQLYEYNASVAIVIKYSGEKIIYHVIDSSDFRLFYNQLQNMAKSFIEEIQLRLNLLKNINRISDPIFYQLGKKSEYTNCWDDFSVKYIKNFMTKLNKIDLCGFSKIESDLTVDGFSIVNIYNVEVLSQKENRCSIHSAINGYSIFNNLKDPLSKFDSFVELAIMAGFGKKDTDVKSYKDLIVGFQDNEFIKQGLNKLKLFPFFIVDKKSQIIDEFFINNFFSDFFKKIVLNFQQWKSVLIINDGILSNYIDGSGSHWVSCVVDFDKSKGEINFYCANSLGGPDFIVEFIKRTFGSKRYQEKLKTDLVIQSLVKKIKSIDLQLKKKENDSVLKLMKFSNQFILMIILYGQKILTKSKI